MTVVRKHALSITLQLIATQMNVRYGSKTDTEIRLTEYQLREFERFLIF